MKKYIRDFLAEVDNQLCIMVVVICFLSLLVGGGMAARSINAQWEEKIKKDYMTKEEVIELIKETKGSEEASAMKLCFLEREITINNEYKH